VARPHVSFSALEQLGIGSILPYPRKQNQPKKAVHYQMVNYKHIGLLSSAPSKTALAATLNRTFLHASTTSPFVPASVAECLVAFNLSANQQEGKEQEGRGVGGRGGEWCRGGRRLGVGASGGGEEGGEIGRNPWT
jgi:hypothetical protein